jgi:hypothetical protein
MSAAGGARKTSKRLAREEERMKGRQGRSWSVTVFVGLVLAAFSAAVVAADDQEKASPPDFTRGGQKDDAHDWTLGPSGARGWIYTSHGHSADARQILVTDVAPKSPADGVLAVGDVILGIDGQAFLGDARVQFARALMTAETEPGGGRLRLLRWRDGASAEVTLQLPVLGSYSATAPCDCPKSQRILDQGCRLLAHRMGEASYAQKMNAIPRALNALALLASGDAAYRPLLQQEARWAADFTPGDFKPWYYGYVTTFLAEYVLATGDVAVLPGLKRQVMESVRGQSKVGTWGHNFASPQGNASGYGCMNQPGISLCIGLVLAREAGVHDPELDRAIAKAADFLRWFVNKGAIPYGDHQPYPAHEDNGKCSSAAVLFDLLGDREAAEFFAKMSTAAYSERERGHTGNFFNVLWALPGVSRCGPHATGAYLHEQAWYYDLARRWDGSFLYQGSPVGEEEHHKYTGWDCTGGYLLAYALPRKSLRLTGKQASCVPPLDRSEAAAVIAAGGDYEYKGDASRYDQRSTDQLLAGLSSWSPNVRRRSANSLARRDGDFVSTLLELLAGTNRDARYGACEALGALGSRADAAAPVLRRLLQEPDPWLQSLACFAIPNLSPEVRRDAVGDLLRMTVTPNPADPRGMAQRAAAIALFSPYPGQRGPQSILAESLEGVDRKLLYPAVQTLLQNDDSVVRGSMRKIYGELTERDLVELLPAILASTERIAPSNEMFADGVRLAGLDLLSRLHLREAMPLCVSVIEPGRWGMGNRLAPCLNDLGRYGVHAKSLLPHLQSLRQQLAATRHQMQHVATVDKAIAAIEAATAAPTLLSIEEFKARSAP